MRSLMRSPEYWLIGVGVLLAASIFLLAGAVWSRENDDPIALRSICDSLTPVTPQDALDTIIDSTIATAQAQECRRQPSPQP